MFTIVTKWGDVSWYQQFRANIEAQWINLQAKDIPSISTLEYKYRT